ncbi:hypothetical protein JCM15519_30660 [Fundidesulfovibrio butyratiphilus]
MSKVCVLALMVFVLAACSGRPSVSNSNKTQAQAQADYDECLSQGALAAALVPKGKSPDELREKRIDECMKAKGYDVK